MTTQGATAGIAGPARTARPQPFLRGARRWTLGGALVLALVFGLVLVLWRQQVARQHSAVDYTTALVERGTISAKVTANGAVSPLVTVKVGSQVSGRIAALYADYGSEVTEGQTIAKIEPSLFRAAVAQARANAIAARAALERARAELLQAERRFARASRLFAEGVSTRADMEAAEAELEVAKAQRTTAQASIAQANAALAQAELNLKYTTIVSPIDGVVISRDVDVGQTVAAALQAPTIFTIAQDLTRMQVDTSVAEADVARIREGMPATFVVDAHPDRVFHGRVRQVRDAAQTVQNVVTYDAVIDVDNHELLLKPGMTASVTFVYATLEGVLRVPNAALRFKPDPATRRAMVPDGDEQARRPIAADERTVWTLRGGRAERVVVRAGLSDGVHTAVEGGVREGEPVVVEARLATDGPGA